MEHINKEENEQVKKPRREYGEYFFRQYRVNGEGFYSLKENAPQELIDLVYDIHRIFESGPNDWIYENISDAFDGLADCSLDEVTIQTDCYHSALYKWFGESYANDLCQEYVDEFGYPSKIGVMYALIDAGQWLAMKKIYGKVDEFINEEIDGI